MATVSHTIYSYYDPNDRERWRKKPDRNPAPPRFVPATLPFDSWDFSQSSSRQKQENNKQAAGGSIADWYRSIRKNLASYEVHPQPSHSSAAIPSQRTSATLKSSHKVELNAGERRDKNNWFITNAIHSETSHSTTLKPKPPPPTLADILARDPPPKPNEPKYTPSVFLEIGPNNKGFAMLQRSGWTEGEALGPDIVRQRRKVEDLDGELFWDSVAKDRGRIARKHDRGKGRLRVAMDANQIRPEDFIDLTQSDSESDAGRDGELEGFDEYTIGPSGVATPFAKPEPPGGEASPPSRLGPPVSLPETPEGEEDTKYGRKALITPLATVLKSDRLGIGLKAKTVGPYKASRKRITHNTAALVAHVKAGEELRKKKRKLGRGHRGFERQYRTEAMKRQMMLTYLNS